jgi:hypothetical protein
MEILRSNAETVEVVGLDEAYIDLSDLFSPKATMRRIAAAARRMHRRRPYRRLRPHEPSPESTPGNRTTPTGGCHGNGQLPNSVEEDARCP